MFFVVNQTPSGMEIERFRTDFSYDDSVSKDFAPRCAKCGSFIGGKQKGQGGRKRVYGKEIQIKETKYHQG